MIAIKLRRKLPFFYFLLIALSISYKLRAQPRDTSLYAGRLYYWDDIPAYLNDQAANTLETVARVLKADPPNAVLDDKRRSAFLLLDNVFHQPEAPHLPAVQDYYHHQMADLLAHLQTHPVRSGAEIYKLYNHGFIVATPDALLWFEFVFAIFLIRIDRAKLRLRLLWRLSERSGFCYLGGSECFHILATGD